MSHQIVVAVASKYGHTHEIGERIAAVLRGAGLDAVVQDAASMHDLAGVQAVVLGSAIYLGRWRADAVDFLRIHERGLTGLPLWIFSSGPLGEGEPEQLIDGWHLPDAVLDLLDRIGVVDSVLFHGALEPEQLNLAERWVMRAVGAKEGDFRDWDAIEAWARGIAAALSPAEE